MSEYNSDRPEKDLGASVPATWSDKEGVVADITPEAVPSNSIEMYTRKQESRVLHKFDLFVVIPIGLFYLLAILDRNNLGNANIAGMPQDIGLVGNQFGTAATLLYATYVPFETPVALLVKRIGPKILISSIALGWGVSTLGMAFIQDFKGLYACRLLVGMFEPGLIPANEIYLGLVFNRSERSRRMGLFYTFSCLSSAFGGLLAYGLTQLHGPNGFQGWRWLFAVEAALTICLVPIFYFIFPKSPIDAWLLTPHEKQIVRARYDSDPHWVYDEKFSWSEVVKAFVDPKFYAFFVYQFSVNLTQFGFTTFLPSIITSLGYRSVQANLMTVPIYFTALAFFLASAFASDHLRMKGPFMAGACLIIVLGEALLIASEDNVVRFAACFLTAIGLYPAAALSMMWLQDNVSGFYKRSSMLGVTLTFANIAGVIVGQIFTTDTAPSYQRGIAICMGFASIAFLITCALMLGMVVVNKKRAKAIGEARAAGTPIPTQPEKGDYDPHFRYAL